MEWPTKISVNLRRGEAGLIVILAIIVLGVYLYIIAESAAAVNFVIFGVALSVLLILSYIIFGGKEEDYWNSFHDKKLLFSNKFEITPIYSNAQSFCGDGMEDGTHHMVDNFVAICQASYYWNLQIPDLRKVNKPTETHLQNKVCVGDFKWLAKRFMLCLRIVVPDQPTLQKYLPEACLKPRWRPRCSIKKKRCISLTARRWKK